MNDTAETVLIKPSFVKVGPMDLVSGIAAAKQALDIARSLRSIDKSYDEATLKSQLADLMMALADTKIAMAEAKDKLEEKQKEIDSLRENFQYRSTLVKAEGDYKYLPGEDGNPLGFPICPTCEIDGKIVQLKQNDDVVQARCPKCKSEFKPVSCFIGGADGTLHAREKRLKSEKIARQNARVARINNRSGFR